MKRNDMYRIYLGGAKSSSKRINNVESQNYDAVGKDPSKGASSKFYSEDYYNSMTVGEWIKLKPLGLSFTPRTGHEVIYYKQKIYLFGGTD